MGGIGSGRRYQGGKDTTEDSLPLDIRKLQRAGLLTPGNSFSWQWTVNDRPVASIGVRVEVETVTLVYRSACGGEVELEDVEHSIRMDRTACTYGGARHWWLCPMCGGRVALLYGPGRYFACRRCLKLVYACQREAADDRAARRADRIRRKLGWKPGILNGTGDRPKGMHWRTYERLTHCHNLLAMASFEGIAKRFGFLDRLQKWRQQAGRGS